MGAISAYRFSNVIRDHEVEIQFEKVAETYQIIINSGEGGATAPGAAVSVNFGASQLVEFTPDAGFRVLNVLVNGVSQGALSSYLFNNVQKDQILEVSFVEDTKSYSIRSLVIASGKMRSLSVVAVEKGESAISAYQAIAPSEIVDVKVDGVSYGVLKSVSFANVNEDHQVVFVTELTDLSIYPVDYDPNYSPAIGCQYSSRASNAKAFELILLLMALLFITKTAWTRK